MRWHLAQMTEHLIRWQKDKILKWASQLLWNVYNPKIQNQICKHDFVSIIKGCFIGGCKDRIGRIDNT